MMIGGVDMKLLKIENNLGYYLKDSDDYISVDKITKDDLLKLVAKKLLTKIKDGHEYVFRPSRGITEKLRGDHQKVS